MCIRDSYIGIHPKWQRYYTCKTGNIYSLRIIRWDSYWISAYKNGNYCLILLKLIFFLIFFLATKKDCILHSYLCIVKTKIVKVEGHILLLSDQTWIIWNYCLLRYCVSLFTITSIYKIIFLFYNSSCKFYII